ncbi:MAG: hypothetical protein AAF843_20300 [Bacteroidota bacterium]
MLTPCSILMHLSIFRLYSNTKRTEVETQGLSLYLAISSLLAMGLFLLFDEVYKFDLLGLAVWLNEQNILRPAPMNYR